MGDKIISVIVPVYKVEKYLRKCIDSIINQTYKNLEIILVDDGSPDNCGAICDEYTANDSRVKVIHKENGGLSSARNAGIDIASGDYIAFIDSDDYIDVNMIKTLYKKISDDNSDMAICNFSYVDENGKMIYEKNEYMPIKTEVISGRDILYNKLLEAKSWYWVIACNKIYKKSLFDGIRYPIGKLNEDEFIIHEIYFRCKKISCIETSMYYYVQRSNSIINGEYSVRRLDAIEAYLKRLNFVFINNFDSNIIYKYYLCYWGCLADSYKRANMNDRGYKLRYKELQKEYRCMYIGLMKRTSRIKNKVMLTLNYVSPYCAWKIMDILFSLRNKNR